MIYIWMSQTNLPVASIVYGTNDLYLNEPDKPSSCKHCIWNQWFIFEWARQTFQLQALYKKPMIYIWMSQTNHPVASTVYGTDDLYLNEPDKPSSCKHCIWNQWFIFEWAWQTFQLQALYMEPMLYIWMSQTNLPVASTVYGTNDLYLNEQDKPSSCKHCIWNQWFIFEWARQTFQLQTLYMEPMIYIWISLTNLPVASTVYGTNDLHLNEPDKPSSCKHCMWNQWFIFEWARQTFQLQALYMEPMIYIVTHKLPSSIIFFQTKSEFFINTTSSRGDRW